MGTHTSSDKTDELMTPKEWMSIMRPVVTAWRKKAQEDFDSTFQKAFWGEESQEKQSGNPYKF